MGCRRCSTSTAEKNKALDALANIRQQTIRMRQVINVLARLHEGTLQTGTPSQFRVSAKTLKTAWDIKKKMEKPSETRF
jgi:hypothetical protein